MRLFADCFARSRWVLLTLTLAWAWPALGDFEAGAKAYTTGDFTGAYNAWIPAATAGDPAAQFGLSMLYSQGKGVAADNQEALRWLRMAAERGHVDAQFTLGLYYNQGIGVPVNPEEAVKWYQAAASQEDSSAQLALALMHAHGAGIDQNLSQAIQWFRRAAGHGQIEALASLGLMYETGSGVAQNDTCAYAWYTLAGARGSDGAIRKRDDLREKMHPREVALGQAFAVSIEQTKGCPKGVEGDQTQRSLVAAVQGGLASLGYESAARLGLVDPQTTLAVQAFQQDLGLTPTGKISEELLMLIKSRLESQ